MAPAPWGPQIGAARPIGQYLAHVRPGSMQLPAFCPWNGQEEELGRTENRLWPLRQAYVRAQRACRLPNQFPMRNGKIAMKLPDGVTMSMRASGERRMTKT